MTDRFLTVVVRNPTTEEASELVYHPKLSATSWSHAMDIRDGYFYRLQNMTDLLARLLALAELAVDEALQFEYGDPEDRHIWRELQELKPLVATALAQPEPEGPTDEEIMRLMPQQMHEDLATAARAIAEQTGIDSRRAMGMMRIILNRHAVDLARAVLARWGRPTPPPADDGPAVPKGREPASVEQQATADELLQAYQAGRRDAEADAQQAAEAAQEPPAEGEGRDLAVLLSVGADCAGGARLTSAQCRRAADLLTRLALQPVPTFTRAQLLKLQDVLSTHQDEGPPGEGWASPELAALRAIVDELCDNHSTSENV